MNDSQIAEILRDRNRWWTDPESWWRDDPYLLEVAEAPFEYRPAPLDDIAPPGLYTLSGPRRVGKSVELRRAISRLISGGANPRAIVYCSCDGFRPQDLRRLFTVGRNLTRTVEGPRHWLIDEVTAVGPEWSAIIKDLRDDTPLRYDCVVLTGSSGRGLREATKRLAGRRGGVADSDRLLLPMSFRAFCGSIGGLDRLPALESLRPREVMTRAGREALNELSFWTDALTEAWETYLHVGGLPRAVRDFLEVGEVRPDLMNDLWDVIRGEAIRATSLSETELLALLARIGDGMASPLNASSVASDVGLGNHHQVNERINDLALAFLAWKCHRAIDGRPSVKAFRKVYFIDPLIARIPRARSSAYSVPDATKLTEQQIGLALARLIERQRPHSFVEAAGVMYERTRGSEIDFVGPELGVPVESKYVARKWKLEARPMLSRYGKGVLVTRNVYDTEGPAWAVPAAALAWLVSPW